MRGMTDAYEILAEKPQLRNLYGRFRRKWQNNNKKENFNGMNWTFVAHEKNDWQVIVYVEKNVRTLNKDSN